MKTLLMLAFTVFMAIALADDSAPKNLSNPDAQALNAKKKMHETKSTKAYKLAKEACLHTSEGIRGKKLTECIVNYQKEAK